MTNSEVILLILMHTALGCSGIKLYDNSTTARIWAHLKSKGGSLLLERPGEMTGKPDIVGISLYIKHLRSLDATESGFVFDMFVRYSWFDARMAYNEGPYKITLPMSVAKNVIWMPDLFFANAHEISVHSAVDMHSGVFIERNGEVTASSRMTVTAYCDMDLRKFPHDKQICGLEIESYMFTNDSLKMVWKDAHLGVSTSPVAFKSSYRSKLIKAEFTTTGVYESAQVTIDLVRINDHFMVLLYVPCVVLLLLSMLQLCLPLTALLARTLFGAILLFSMTIILVGSQYGSPQVGYVKAVDIWVVSCFVFLAVALLESIILHMLFDRCNLSARGDQFQLIREDEMAKTSGDAKVGHWLIRPEVTHKIDLALRIIYPAAFVLFNALYWGICVA